MKKDVMINLKSIQSNKNDSSETELITAGVLEAIDGGYSISYDESVITGYNNAKTVLTCIGNEYANIERVGEMSSNLIIEKNKKHHCHYGTPYGDFMVGIYPHAIVNELNDEGGNLYIKYTVDINSSYISDNEILIVI